jgi:hypothetical protein
MNLDKLIFAQLVAHIPEVKFRRLVEKYQGNLGVRTFSCWDQLLCMLFAQLTYRESLRDIEACLTALGSKLYHMGIRGNLSRTNLARANEKRDWRIYQDLALHLIKIARGLYAQDDFEEELKNTAYAFDSTTIDLCLALFPWAHFMNGNGGKTKGAIKLHTLLDLRGNIPTFIHISDGKLFDVCALDYLPIEPLAFYVMDRGYHDFQRLYRFTQAHAFFVTRPRRNTKYRRLYSHEVDKTSGILSDQTIMLTGGNTQSYYPKKLRRILYRDPETKKRLVFITNNFDLSSPMVAKLYKARWQVELFFKWIKQHLRIKKFYGTSKNAVRTQIWIAVATYVLVAIVKKRLKLNQSLYTILQVLSVSLVEKTPILSAFQHGQDSKSSVTRDNQLSLFPI